MRHRPRLPVGPAAPGGCGPADRAWKSRGPRACEACGVQSQRDYVLRTVEERGIRFVQLWFTDVLGTPKGFNITSAELENALDEGMTFDGSAIDGFSRVQEADVLARPDPKTFQLLPWHHDDAPVARVFCDIANLDGTPFEGDPRHALRRTLERARDRRLHLLRLARDRVLLLRRRGPRARARSPLDSGSYFDLTVADLTSDLRRRSVLILEEMGIPVEHTQHEDARSQHEIDLRYTDALTMADTVMTARMVVKEMARQEGVFASLHAQAPGRRAGLGHAHPHLPVARGSATPSSTRTTSTGSPTWPAGSSPACCTTPARSPPSPTSGSTPTSGSSAATRRPSTSSWARNNRSALVRVPVVKNGQERVDPARVPGARQRRATRTWPSP